MAYPFYNLYNGIISYTMPFIALKPKIPWDYGQRQFSPWALHCQARYELMTIFMYNMVATMYRIKIGFSIAVLVYVSGFTKRSRIFKERTWYGLSRCGQLTTTAVGSLPLAGQFIGEFPCAGSMGIPGCHVARCQCLPWLCYNTVFNVSSHATPMWVRRYNHFLFRWSGSYRPCRSLCHNDTTPSRKYQ